MLRRINFLNKFFTITITLGLLFPSYGQKSITAQQAAYAALGMGAAWLADQAGCLTSNEKLINQAIQYYIPQQLQWLNIGTLISNQNKLLYGHLLETLFLDPTYEERYNDFYMSGLKSLGLIQVLKSALDAWEASPNLITSQAQETPITCPSGEILPARVCGIRGVSGPGRGTFVSEEDIVCPWSDGTYAQHINEDFIKQAIFSALSGYFLSPLALGLAKQITPTMHPLVYRIITTDIAYIITTAIWNALLSNVLKEPRNILYEKLYALGGKVARSSDSLAAWRKALQA